MKTLRPLPPATHPFMSFAYYHGGAQAKDHSEMLEVAISRAEHLRQRFGFGGVNIPGRGVAIFARNEHTVFIPTVIEIAKEVAL